MRARRISAVLFFLAGTTFGAEPGATAAGRLDWRDEVIQGLTFKDSKAGDGPVEVTIASYNVQTRPFLDEATEKLPQISPLLNTYDVVLIQECFTRHDLLWKDADFPNKVYFGRLANRHKVTNSGLSILAKLPMGETVSEHYRDVGELQNRLASKGVLLVRLLAGSVPLDVYNTHMEAGHTAAAQKARHGQAAQLIKFVSENSPADHAVVLMGDFNMGPRRESKAWQDYRPNHYASEEDMKSRTEAFERLRRKLHLQDAADDLHGPTDDGIERLLFRTGSRSTIEVLACDFDTTRFRRADNSALSDGSPLVVRLRISPRAVR